MKLIIYTHTDYLDIYKIQQDHLNLLNISDNIVIFTNKHNPYYKYNQIYYND
jgi:hypothetical protein